MIIRDATRDDVPRIVELMQQLSMPAVLSDGTIWRERDPHDPAYTKAFDDIRAQDARHRILVVEMEHRIVGTAQLFVRPNLSHAGRPVAEIESVVVDEGARGRGVGEALIRFCIERANDVGCFRVQLTSNTKRADAHRFYERLGFTPSHTGFKLYL